MFNHHSHYRLLHSLIFCTLLCFFVSIPTINAATTGTWTSKTTGTALTYTVTDATTPLKDASSKYLTVVYLENLGIRKLGQNSNAADVSWLLSQGYRVIEMDYAHHAKAVSPLINDDIIAINDALYAAAFAGKTDCSQYRSWILFEGYRIKKDVPYFVDDPSVYNYSTSYTAGDSLRMDIIYPANTLSPVPVVLSFSYSNSYWGATTMNQRMNLGNYMAGFDDSFQEGAPANGIAWAIADHPKYCPWGNGKPTGATNNKAYGGYATNPDAAQKVKSAIRTLRKQGEGLGLSGKIGIYGFSRGSTTGSLAVGDSAVSNFQNAGFNSGVSDAVQVAALGSGVFDYTLIYDQTGDGDGTLETNCPLGWGALSTNYALWKSQGASYTVHSSASAPVIFFYNTDDALYYQSQITRFKAKLDQLGVPTALFTNYGTGHSVPTTATYLTTMYRFFTNYLTPPSVDLATGTDDVFATGLSLSVSPNPGTDHLSMQFQLGSAAKVLTELCDIHGAVVYRSQQDYSSPGKQTKTIDLSTAGIAGGIYLLRVTAGSSQQCCKWIRK